MSHNACISRCMLAHTAYSHMRTCTCCVCTEASGLLRSAARVTGLFQGCIGRLGARHRWMWAREVVGQGRGWRRCERLPSSHITSLCAHTVWTRKTIADRASASNFVGPRDGGFACFEITVSE